MLRIKKHNNLKEDIFVNQPNIILVRKFTELALEQFIKDFRSVETSGQEIIPIQVDSYGGSIDSLFGMLELMAQTDKTVCTFTTTKAHSCGSVLLAAGTPGFRFAGKNSSVLVHEISSATYGKFNDMNNDIEFMDIQNARLLATLDKFCKQEKNFFKEKLRENGNADLYYTATQAAKVNLIDAVKSPIFEVEVTQKFRLC